MVKKTFSILATLLFVAQGIWGQVSWHQETVYTAERLLYLLDPGGVEITLGDNIELDSETRMEINCTTIILNLNGYTLRRNMAAPDEWGQVICIMDHGRLWINDNGDNRY